MTEQQGEGSAGHVTYGPDPAVLPSPVDHGTGSTHVGVPTCWEKSSPRPCWWVRSRGLPGRLPGGGWAAAQAHPLLLSLPAWLTVRDSLLLKVSQGTVQLGRHSLNHRKVQIYFLPVAKVPR